MKILVACEESQAVCKAFRKRGHETYSCDIEPCSGGHPEWHLQCDALEHHEPYVNGGCKDANGNYRKFQGRKERDPKTRSKKFKGIAEAMAEQWG